MPNRDLKESIRRSPSMQLLSDAAERLWYRLIASVDDFGRLEADSEVVFTTCFQRVPKGWNRQKVQLCLEELATKSYPGDRPLISIYRVGVKSFLQILSSPVHIYQRAKSSKYPSQTNQEVIEIIPQVRTDAGECAQIPSVPESRTPNPESRIPNPVLTSALECAQTVSHFQEFWQIYPLRNGKRLEQAATKALFLKLSVQDQILAVKAARNYAEALKAQGLNAKDPKRWLRDGQGHEPWRDWIVPAPLSSAQRPPPPPPKIDPIARGQWKQVYGNPKDHGYQ